VVLQATEKGAQSTTLGRRYDPAAPLLGALAAPPPNSPDDPLRLAIRRAAQVRLQSSRQPQIVHTCRVSASSHAVVARLEYGTLCWP
jgi:hypothetical protein